SVGSAPAASASATQSLVAGSQPCASGGLAISSIEAPTPTTAPPASASASRTAAPATTAAVPPSPTATPRPAPSADRIGFPEGYQTAFKFLYVYDRADAKSITYVCGNDAAASTRQAQPFNYGSVMVFESWRPKEDAAGNTIKDANGHLIRTTLNAIFVMKKDHDFGEAYQQFRTGEWEYVAYRPDKSYQTPPPGSATCSSCHQASNKDRDWTFRAWELPFTTRYAIAPMPPAGEVSLNRMAFFHAALLVTEPDRVGAIDEVAEAGVVRRERADAASVEVQVVRATGRGRRKATGHRDDVGHVRTNEDLGVRRGRRIVDGRAQRRLL